MNDINDQIADAAALFTGETFEQRSLGVQRLGKIAHAGPSVSVPIALYPSVIDTALIYATGDDRRAAILGLSLLANLASHGAGRTLVAHPGFNAKLQFMASNPALGCYVDMIREDLPQLPTSMPAQSATPAPGKF